MATAFDTHGQAAACPCGYRWGSRTHLVGWTIAAPGIGTVVERTDASCGG
jgi:hypothetical protein